MTVHGAKGLEAPIVILADTTTVPAGPPQLQPRLLELPAVHAPPDTPGPLIWAGPRKEDVPALAKARDAMLDAAENEHRRLLYVAMTRAADRLIICGATGERGKPERCWYDLMHGALTAGASEEPAEDGDGTVWRYRGTLAPTGDTAAPARQPGAALPADARPDWLDRDAPVERPPDQSISPSRADAADVAIPPDHSGTSQERIRALARGDLMQRLLQALPDIPPERRAETARRHIARAAMPFPTEERERMVEQLGAVLGDARFAELFGPGSRAEVPIVGRVTRGGRTLSVSGQIDRLAVTPASVLIADYKTNRPAPRRPEEVPRPYLTQLALYRAVLGQLYPDKAIRAVLVWTDVPDLMEISAAALEEALARPHLPVKPA
jgi:ATP-dependent helicase/nuclease subunit A